MLSNGGRSRAENRQLYSASQTSPTQNNETTPSAQPSNESGQMCGGTTLLNSLFFQCSLLGNASASGNTLGVKVAQHGAPVVSDTNLFGNCPSTVVNLGFQVFGCGAWSSWLWGCGQAGSTFGFSFCFHRQFIFLEAHVLVLWCLTFSRYTSCVHALGAVMLAPVHSSFGVGFVTSQFRIEKHCDHREVHESRNEQ